VEMACSIFLYTFCQFSQADKHSNYVMGTHSGGRTLKRNTKIGVTRTDFDGEDKILDRSFKNGDSFRERNILFRD